MQISRNWLEEFVEIKFSDDELCNQLTMLGLEVEGFSKFKSKITGTAVSYTHLTLPTKA